MFSAAVQRGDLRFPRVIEDDFNRPASSRLGRTPVGWVPWSPRRGTWSISANRLGVPTATTDGVLLLNARFPDVELTVDISNASGDALVLRATDALNYLRVANFYFFNVTVVTEEETRWRSVYGNPEPITFTQYRWRGEWGGYAIPGFHGHPTSHPPTSASTEQMDFHHDLPGQPRNPGALPIVKHMWSQSDDACPFPPDVVNRNNPHTGGVRGTGEIHSHNLYSDDFDEAPAPSRSVMNTHRHPRTSCELTGESRVRTVASAPDHGHTLSRWRATEDGDPHAAELTHAHSGMGTHTHLRTSATTPETREVEIDRITTVIRRVYVDRVQAGDVTNLATWDTGTNSRLRVVADGSSIEVYGGADGQSSLGSLTTSFNQTAVRHGLGRRRGGTHGTALDNFTLTVIE